MVKEKSKKLTVCHKGLYSMMEMMTVIFMGLVMVVLSTKPETRLSNPLLEIYKMSRSSKQGLNFTFDYSKFLLNVFNRQYISLSCLHNCELDLINYDHCANI